LSLAPLVKKMLAQMLDSSDNDRNYLSISKQDKTVLFINNLGGVSPLELGGIVTEVHTQLTKSYGIKPVRIIAGTFMTSLNGLGFSITLLKLADAGIGVSMIDLLDTPAEAVGWTSCIRAQTWESQGETAATQQTQERSLEVESQPSNIKSESANM
jgi:triose/dihydroxyacetone kinase / FAD-AMP lyase (cyclizing)